MARYQTVLEVINHDRATGETVVISGWGKTSDWYRNVMFSGHAKITLGRQTIAVDARVLDNQDAARAVAGYERRNRWMGLIVRWVLSQLVGFNYDGTDDSRLALVGQLPVVGFTPAPSATR